MEASQTSAERKIDHRWFAGFICLIGYLLLIVAITQAVWSRAGTGYPQAPTWISFWVAIAGIGVLLAFLGLHLMSTLVQPSAGGPALSGSASSQSGEDAAGPPPAPRKWLTASRQRYFVMAGLVLIFAAVYFLVAGARTASSAPSQPTQFALALPPPTAEERVAAPSSSVAAPAAVAAPPPAPAGGAVLFWNVPGEGLPVNPGLLPMSIAASLIVAFGLFYPQIASSGDDEGKGFVQKLVVPGLGLILFGVGASQQAGAQESRENVRLVSQNLPPFFAAPRSERRGYVLRAGDTSIVTTQQLQASIHELMEQVKKDEKEENILQLSAEDRLQLINQLNNVREDIRDGATLIDARTASQVRRIRKDLEIGFLSAQSSVDKVEAAVTASSLQLDKSLAALSSDERATFCAVLQSELAAAKTRSHLALAQVDRADAKARENIFRRAWLSTVGRDPKLSKAFRDRIASRPGDAEAEISAAQSLCLAASRAPR